MLTNPCLKAVDLLVRTSGNDLTRVSKVRSHLRMLGYTRAEIDASLEELAMRLRADIERARSNSYGCA